MKVDRKKVRRELTKLAAVLAAAAVFGLAVAASGLVPIKASSGHWAITAWFLSFSMHRSVATHSVGIDAPPLDDTRLVLKGAGHFEIGCQPCHGSPLMSGPRIAQRMTPHPPDLSGSVPNWEPDELFYIVKHGVKFTGMPAWPAPQREDEVWAVTAFLQKLPQLNAEQYRRLVRPETTDEGDPPLEKLTDPDAPELLRSCAGCHGYEGQGRGVGAFPGLAGQTAEYLTASLQAYARGNRFSGIMEPIAAGLGDDAIERVAEFYSRLPGPLAEPGAGTTETVSENGEDERALAIERGAAIARDGIPDQKVPSCVDCHGPTDEQGNSNYPSLAGQYWEYLVLQLELFQQRNRGGSPHAHLMYPVADGLSPAQRRDVALYYASLRGE